MIVHAYKWRVGEITMHVGPKGERGTSLMFCLPGSARKNRPKINEKRVIWIENQQEN